MTPRTGWALMTRLLSCATLCVACGGCSTCGYACAMWWGGLTNISSSVQDRIEADLILKTDAFLMSGKGELRLARPGVRCGVPTSAECYRRFSFFFPAVEELVPKGTRLRRIQLEYHQVGYIFWHVYHAEIRSGPHAGEKVRLDGFGNKVTHESLWVATEEDPNPDLLEYAPRKDITTQSTTTAPSTTRPAPPYPTPHTLMPQSG